MTKGSFSDLAQPGARFVVRATPRARRNQVLRDGETFRISVTAPADEGRANAAVVEALAGVLGVAKSRLTLLHGATSRDKLFRLD